jgi:hypothetical protein
MGPSLCEPRAINSFRLTHSATHVVETAASICRTLPTLPVGNSLPTISEKQPSATISRSSRSTEEGQPSCGVVACRTCVAATKPRTLRHGRRGSAGRFRPGLRYGLPPRHKPAPLSHRRRRRTPPTVPVNECANPQRAVSPAQTGSDPGERCSAHTPGSLFSLPDIIYIIGVFY